MKGCGKAWRRKDAAWWSSQTNIRNLSECYRRLDVEIVIAGQEEFIQYRFLHTWIQRHIAICLQRHELWGHQRNCCDMEMHPRKLPDQLLTMFYPLGIGTDQCLRLMPVFFPELIDVAQLPYPGRVGPHFQQPVIVPPLL